MGSIIVAMADGSLLNGLLNTLEREMLPAVERGDGLAWSRANRIADAVLVLLSDEERARADLPTQSIGALQSLYLLASRTGKSEAEARASAIYTFTTRARPSVHSQRMPPSSGSRAPSPSLGVIAAPSRNFPTWVPESGIIGGFRLVRSMASGGLGSLFLARRLQDEGNPQSRDVVLKVPHDAGALVIHVDEDELHAQFRAEASALAAIPPHPNLARIEAFDIGARPKPFLVMELVEGLQLEEALDARQLTMPRVLEILDGVLAGLETMHATGVGHLDIKPDNVILRHETGQATLVDFGLSGRTVRKRCGNPLYAAPEVWNDDRESESPFAVDVYSFACLAFEALTCLPLFDSEDALSTIRLHFLHDGWPSPLSELRSRPELVKLTEVLSRALRANPAHRTRIRMLRTELQRLAPNLRELSWPLAGRESRPDDVAPEASGRRDAADRRLEDVETSDRDTG